MKINTRKFLIFAGIALAITANSNAATVIATDLDYGISGTSNNSFALDFSGESIWTAGAQRSENGSVDPNNRRAGRVFVDFQLDAAIIAAANGAGAMASFTFDVISIGGGVAGTPYTDGLDLRLLGTSATDRDALTLWNTPPSGGVDQTDILSTGGVSGSHTVTLTNPSVLSLIAGASAGDYLSFGLSNSAGVSADPVGNSTAETYGFQMNTTPANYGLTVIPEPAASLFFGMASAVFLLQRRRR